MTTGFPRSFFPATLLLGVLALAGCGGEGGQSSDMPNRPPTIGGVPSVGVDAGTAYSFTPRASDPDGDSLTFAASNLPAWATISTSTGEVTGTPGDANVGMTQSITIEVSDGTAVAQLDPFQIQVRARATTPTPPPPPPADPINRAPTISGTPATTVVAGAAYSFTPGAADPDGNALSFSIDNRPTWATFSTSTGRLSGTPAAGNVGTTTGIVIRVSDGTVSTALPTFQIAVTAAPPTNRAPTITGTPPSGVVAGSAYSFTPTAADADGNTLTFGIQNRPAWATFNTSTGRLSGTPTTQQLGTFSNIAITVSDGTATTSLAAFTITVTAPANRAPTVSGSPSTTATVGQAYSFTPTGSDPDGQTLTWSASNLPAWLTITPSTGRISGTPAAAGTAANIIITASDGTSSTSLAAFSITIASGTTNGTAELQWTAPTQNTDGTTLSNLAGFRVSYGRSQTAMDQTVVISNPSVSTHTVENLTSGTWYFAVSAFTSSGAESDRSTIGSKAIN
jgi:hypothetical protein